MPKTVRLRPAAFARLQQQNRQLITLRARIKAPSWWSGHRTLATRYPDGPGTSGYVSAFIHASDGSGQRTCHVGEPGDVLHVAGSDVQLRIESVEVTGHLHGRARRRWRLVCRVLLSSPAP